MNNMGVGDGGREGAREGGIYGLIGNCRLYLLRRRMDTLYRRFGESALTISRIEGLVERHLSGYLIKQSSAHQLKSLRNKHAVFEESSRLLSTSAGLSLSFHEIPPDFTIPTHLHPARLSIVYVLSGRLLIKQSSIEVKPTQKTGTTSLGAKHDSSDRAVSQPVQYCLKPGMAKAGLLHLGNLHELKSADTSCCYLTFHIKAATATNSLDACFKPLLGTVFGARFNSVSGTMLGALLGAKLGATLGAMSGTILGSMFSTLIGAIPGTASANEQDYEPVTFSHTDQREHLLKSRPISLVNSDSQTDHRLIIEARRIHNSSQNESDLYEAAQLYRKAAQRGNAEAQYWLGIFYLEGKGITEDSAEALHWISTSANQGYPPAQEVYDYMLATDDVLNC